MANTHFIFKTATWSTDFPALTVEAQHLYQLLGSQPDITLCGVLSIAVRRWAALSANGSPARTRKALSELVEKRYVVVDETTDELVLRTYVKHAGGLKIPNVVIGLTRDYTKIASASLRRVVLEQVDEAPLARIKARSRIPERFVREWEAFTGKAFPVVCAEPQGERVGEQMDELIDEGFPEGFPEQLDEGSRDQPRIQPTTDNRQPTTYIDSSLAASSPTNRKKAERKRDPLVDALARVDLGSSDAPLDQVTGAAWKRAAKAASELRPLDATPDEVYVRAGRYRRRWPDRTLSGLALASHWAELATDSTPAAHRSSPSTPVARQVAAADAILARIAASDGIRPMTLREIGAAQ